MTPPVRKPNRLPHQEIYKSNNSFFVTICVEGRVCIFDKCVNGNMVNNNGDTVVAPTIEITKLCEKSLLNLYDLYKNISISERVIMPNHIHFIIHFNDTPVSKITNKVSNLGNIIKLFKLDFQKTIVGATTVSLLLQNYFKQIQFNHHQIWQKSFYDNVIRGEKDLHRIRQYIYNNPLQWHIDSLNPINSLNTRHNQVFE